MWDASFGRALAADRANSMFGSELQQRRVLADVHYRELLPPDHHRRSSCESQQRSKISAKPDF
jgi:hypothetical protein